MVPVCIASFAVCIVVLFVSDNIFKQLFFSFVFSVGYDAIALIECILLGRPEAVDHAIIAALLAIVTPIFMLVVHLAHKSITKVSFKCQ